jgi:putative effector of murein hydrolase LrgA (UPF0299 family)
MPILFIIPAVGVIEIFGDIKAIWIWVIVVLVITYLVAMLSTGWIAQFLINGKKGDK